MDQIFIFGAKYLVIASGLLAMYLFWKSDAETRKRIFKFGVVSLPLTYIFGLIARVLYYNPRPFMVSGVEPLIEHAPDNGFPSDHVLLVSALAVLVTAFDRRLGALAWVIALLVAVSRVYTGVHHALDVVASILISILVGGVLYYFLNNRKQNATNHASGQ